MRLWFLLLTMVAGGLGLSACAAQEPPKQQGVNVTHSYQLLRSPPEQPHTPADRRSLANVSHYHPDAPISNPQLANRHHHIWVVVSGHLLCLAEPRGVACKPKSASRAEGIMLGTFQPPSKRIPVPHNFLLEGIVPDNVSRLVLIVGRSQARTIVVRHNVFLVRGDEPVRVKRLIRHR
jgi:hypothetical protein